MPGRATPPGNISSSSNAQVTITLPTYTIGGYLNGLIGTIVLQDNGGDNLTILSANGPFTFATALSNGAAYAVTVLTNPLGQLCSVSAGTGTVSGGNVNTVEVYCTASGGEPQISNIISSTTATTAIVSWTTDEAATSSINYGISDSYGLASSSAISTTSHSFFLSGLAVYTNYHFRLTSGDAAGNLATTSDLTFHTTDNILPIVTIFILPTNYGSLTVPVTTFTAVDNVGVTGYFLSESASTPSLAASGWSPTAQASYTFLTLGLKTLYAWARDAAGNISYSLNSSEPSPPPTYTISATVSGSSGNFVLQDNGGDNTGLLMPMVPILLPPRS